MIVLLVLSLSIAAPALAQAPTPPTPRDALIQDIQARAQRGGHSPAAGSDWRFQSRPGSRARGRRRPAPRDDGQKPPERQGKILFIDAVVEVARERAQSFLKPEHQERILEAYRTFGGEPAFAKAVTQEEIAAQRYSLSIPL